MQTGKFLGVENGMMKIEYQCTVIEGTEGPDENGNWGKPHIETRVFEHPYRNGGIPYRDTRFHGFEGNLPKIGEGVMFDQHAQPDMAGHLMVDVYPVEVA